MIRTHLLPLVILFSTLGLTYSNCLNNEFVWDDEFLVQKNTYLTDFKFIPKILISNSTAGFGGKDNFYRPTQNLMYLFVYQFLGPHPVGFHFANIFVHFLNSVLLYFLLIRLFQMPLFAFSASLLWALHPAHVEAIAYISGSADPLSLLFFLSSALAFPLVQSSHPRKRLLASLFFFGLSLLSKESLIVAPTLLCLLIFFKSKDFKIKSYFSTLPFWVLAFVYLIARQTILNFDKTFEFYKTTNIYTENIIFRIYTYLATLPEYFKILALPWNLHMERSFPVHVNFSNVPVILGFIFACLSFFISIFLFFKKQQKIPLFCWLWFFVSFVPMNGILLPVNSFILEHWLYLPSLSIFILLGFLIQKIHRQHKRLSFLPLILLGFYFGFLTYTRNKDWKDPITFYSNILQYSVGSARVHNNIAMAYSDKEMWTDSIKHYEKAIELSDVYPQTHFNLARVYITLQKESLALKHLERSLELNPEFTYSTQLKNELLKFMKQKEQSL